MTCRRCGHGTHQHRCNECVHVADNRRARDWWSSSPAVTEGEANGVASNNLEPIGGSACRPDETSIQCDALLRQPPGRQPGDPVPVDQHPRRSGTTVPEDASHRVDRQWRSNRLEDTDDVGGKARRSSRAHGLSLGRRTQHGRPFRVDRELNAPLAEELDADRSRMRPRPRPGPP